MTQAQWAWHSFPNPQNYSLAQVEVPVKVRGKSQKYPYLSDWERRSSRLSNGCARIRIAFRWEDLAFMLMKADGKPAAFSDLSATRQSLDMFTRAARQQLCVRR